MTYAPLESNEDVFDWNEWRKEEERAHKPESQATMKRPRKRYTSELEIISAIDAHLTKIAAECKSAEEGDRLADTLFKRIALLGEPDKLKGKSLSEYHNSRMVANEARLQADKLRRMQGRRQKLLLRLKDTLARFRTQPMVFMPDASVPLAGAL